MLRKVSEDSGCVDGSCPALWATEDAEAYVVQGYVIADPERLVQLDLPEGETAVLVPAAMLEGYFRAQR